MTVNSMDQYSFRSFSPSEDLPFGMVHRDLKPANIILAANDDNSYTVKIADFGLAEKTLKHKCYRKPYYLQPPEELFGCYTVGTGYQYKTEDYSAVCITRIHIKYFRVTYGPLGCCLSICCSVG